MVYPTPTNPRPTTSALRTPTGTARAQAGSISGDPASVASRIGGVLSDGDMGEPWTGGSNLAVMPAPTYLTQRRPYKYTASQTLLNKIESGITEKLGTSGEESTCTFEHWMRLQSNGHIKHGLDTVFRIPNESWTDETYLFDCYNKSWASVKPWVQQLQTGIKHPLKGVRKVCSYDRQNLEYSATFLKASLTSRFRSEIEHAVGLDATGPQVLLSIIERKLHLQASLQRELVSNLEKLSITSEPG